MRSGAPQGRRGRTRGFSAQGRRSQGIWGRKILTPVSRESGKSRTHPERFVHFRKENRCRLGRKGVRSGKRKSVKHLPSGVNVPGRFSHSVFGDGSRARAAGERPWGGRLAPGPAPWWIMALKSGTNPPSHGVVPCLTRPDGAGTPDREPPGCPRSPACRAAMALPETSRRNEAMP